MPRCTHDEVRAISASDADVVVIDECIRDASTWVDLQLAGKCPEQTEQSLAAVEKWLAAHFLTQQDPVLRSATRGDISESYATDTDAPIFARQAATFDPCGIVAAAFLGKVRVMARAGRGFDRRHRGGGV